MTLSSPTTARLGGNVTGTSTVLIGTGVVLEDMDTVAMVSSQLHIKIMSSVIKIMSNVINIHSIEKDLRSPSEA